MIFTREPIIETVVTPKEGYRLVVRNSKGTGQEEFFVDAVEVVSFGKASFFRSLEKPKCFLVPVSDYEILEVRESRMVLKTTGTERGIKIAGGRESPLKVAKQEVVVEPEVDEEAPLEEQRVDKRRDRRRVRKKRGKDESEETSEQETPKPEERKLERHTLIPPPSTLISESLARTKTPPTTEESPPRERRTFIPPPLVIGEPEPEEEIPF